MTLRGIGDTSANGVVLSADGTLDYSGAVDGGVIPVVGACGADPCTWWDNVYLRQPCEQYLMCADPTSPLLEMVQQGAIVGGAQVLGQTAGSAAEAGMGGFLNPTGQGLSVLSLALIAAAAVFGFELLTRR